MYHLISICISIFNFEVFKMGFMWRMAFILVLAELLTIMIVTRFLDSTVGDNRFQPISGSIDHNSVIVT